MAERKPGQWKVRRWHCPCCQTQKHRRVSDSVAPTCETCGEVMFAARRAWQRDAAFRCAHEVAKRSEAGKRAYATRTAKAAQAKDMDAVLEAFGRFS